MDAKSLINISADEFAKDGHLSKGVRICIIEAAIKGEQMVIDGSCIDAIRIRAALCRQHCYCMRSKTINGICVRMYFNN